MNAAAIKKVLGNIKTLMLGSDVCYGFSDIKQNMKPFATIAIELNKRDEKFQLEKYDCCLIYIKAIEEYKKENKEITSLSTLTISQKDEIANYILKCYLETPFTYDVVVPLEWMKPLGAHEIGGPVAITEGKRLVFSLMPDNYDYFPEVTVETQGFLSHSAEKLFLKKVMQSLSVLIFMLKQNGVVYSSRSHDAFPSSSNIFSDKHKRFLSINAKAQCQKFNFFDNHLSFPIAASRYLNELSLTKNFSLLKNEMATEMVHVAVNVASELLNNRSDEAARVKSAIDWFIQAEINEDDTMSFIQVCMGLESIFGDNESEGGLTKTLADRCAYLIGRNIAERNEIKDEFKKMYKVRSKIVHGSKSYLTQSEEHLKDRAFIYLRTSISREMRNLREIPIRNP